MKKYQFKMSAIGYAEFHLFGDVGYEITSKAIVEDLKNCNASAAVFYINSFGGDALDAVAIFNAIKDFAGNTQAIITGCAMSCASYIALACDTVKMYDNSLYMIHNAWLRECGTANELRESADLLDRVMKPMRAAYMAKSGCTEEQLTEWLDAETYFTADEAKAAGFVDEVLPSGEKQKAAAKMKLGAKEAFTEFLTARANPAKAAKPNNPKGESMKNKAEVIAALNALAETLEGEAKANLEAIIAAIIVLWIEEQIDNTNTGDAEAKRKASIQALSAEHNKDGRFDGIIAKAALGTMSATDVLAEIVKAQNKSIEAMAAEAAKKPDLSFLGQPVKGSAGVEEKELTGIERAKAANRKKFSNKN